MYLQKIISKKNLEKKLFLLTSSRHCPPHHSLALSFLLWFGLRDVWEYSTPRALIQKDNCCFSGILEHRSVEKIAICAHTNRDSFWSEAAQNFEVFFLIIAKIKKSKTYSG
jgi:hypothetical protein